MPRKTPRHGYCGICLGPIGGGPDNDGYPKCTDWDQSGRWTFTKRLRRAHANPDECAMFLDAARAHAKKRKANARKK